MNKPLVSVITIVYNNESGISKTIESVLNQTYDNIQYIVIDGGSTDGTIERIGQYAIDIFSSEKDYGISDAFNKGIRHAKGDLVGIINSGDYYEIDAVELMVTEFLNTKITENAYYVFHGDIRMFKGDVSRVYSPFPLRTFRYQMPVWHPTTFLTRNVYRDFMFNLDYKVAMDYELLSKIYSKGGTFVYLNAVISNMDIDGISNSQAAKGFKEVMIASRKNLKVNRLTSRIYYHHRKALNKLISLLKRNA